uniref:F-box domain-containing protein n=1 Tax=Neogobius melanostomus TaxID=47308 RepID=A0A8C6V2J6_9GOBI
MSSLWLPVEVWTLVFRHLSLSDRLRLRAAYDKIRFI